MAGVSLPGEIPEREVSSAGSPATSRLTIFGIQEVRDVHVGDAFVFLREGREVVGLDGMVLGLTELILLADKKRRLLRLCEIGQG